MKLTNDHDANVDRGVALLDEKLGRDVWLPRLDLTTLSVGSTDRCPVAQATGTDFGDGLVRLGVSEATERAPYAGSPSWTEHHGFGLYRDPLTFTGIPDTRDFDGLTQAWIRKVGELRAESSVSA